MEYEPEDSDLYFFFHHWHGFHFIHGDGGTRAAGFSAGRSPVKRPVEMEFQESAFFHPWSCHTLEVSEKVVRRFCRDQKRFTGLVWITIPDDDHFELKDNWKRYEQLLADLTDAGTAIPPQKRRIREKK